MTDIKLITWDNRWDKIPPARLPKVICEKELETCGSANVSDSDKDAYCKTFAKDNFEILNPNTRSGMWNYLFVKLTGLKIYTRPCPAPKIVQKPCPKQAPVHVDHQVTWSVINTVLLDTNKLIYQANLAIAAAKQKAASPKTGKIILR